MFLEHQRVFTEMQISASFLWGSRQSGCEKSSSKAFHKFFFGTAASTHVNPGSACLGAYSRGGGLGVLGSVAWR